MSIETTVENNVAKGSDSKSEFYGTALGFAAFFIWGLFPLYFYLLRTVPPLVTLSFRAVFATIALLPLVILGGKGRVVLATIRQPKYAIGLFTSMLLTAASWGFFIWLVAVNRTIYCSLGNYACPLVSVAFGALLFHERPSKLAWTAVVIATLAFGVFALGVGRLPWESVVVAFVFPFYSIIRKQLKVDSVTGLTIETLFATPIGAAYILLTGYACAARPEWAVSPYFLALLIGAGALTAVPLLLFGAAVTRVKLSTIGLLDYLCPTGQFLCGVCVFHESTTVYQWISFVLIWIALTIFTVDLLRSEYKSLSAEEKLQHESAAQQDAQLSQQTQDN